MPDHSLKDLPPFKVWREYTPRMTTAAVSVTITLDREEALELLRWDFEREEQNISERLLREIIDLCIQFLNPAGIKSMPSRLVFSLSEQEAAQLSDWCHAHFKYDGRDEDEEPDPFQSLILYKCEHFLAASGI